MNQADERFVDVDGIRTRYFEKGSGETLVLFHGGNFGSNDAADCALDWGLNSYVHLDVSSEADWQDAIAAAVSAYGKLDVLVNNAAIWRGGHVLETDGEQWDAVLDINAKGAFLGTKLAIPEMRRAGGGSIVNISSTAGLVGSRTSTAYSASKGAVRLFTKSTAVQYGAEGIRANSIHPGPIDTAMGDQVWPDAGSREETIERTVLKRIGKPEDIANGALFLASDESSFMTGAELVIDGGLTAQ